MNLLENLNYEGMPVRVELIDDEPWFVAKDVCDVLGIRNSSQAVSRLDEDEKDGVVISDPHGRRQNTRVVSESGLYSLIFTSVKPEAKEFKRWVTHEVLPSLRRTGGYSVAPAVRQAPALPEVGNSLAIAKQLVHVAENHEERLEQLETEQQLLAERPVFGEPAAGVLFPRENPDHLTIREYARCIGRDLTPGQCAGIGHRLSRFCEQAEVFFQRSSHGNRYPLPVLQEFFG